MPSQNEIRQRITSTIVEALKSGGLPPWRRPWAADPNAGFPANVVSKKKYRGINPLLLEIAAMQHGLKGKWWATYTAKAIPVNQRTALRRLEVAGLIEYRNDGWHPTTET